MKIVLSQTDIHKIITYHLISEGYNIDPDDIGITFNFYDLKGRSLRPDRVRVESVFYLTEKKKHENKQ